MRNLGVGLRKGMFQIFFSNVLTIILGTITDHSYKNSIHENILLTIYPAGPLWLVTKMGSPSTWTSCFHSSSGQRKPWVKSVISAPLAQVENSRAYILSKIPFYFPSTFSLCCVCSTSIYSFLVLWPSLKLILHPIFRISLSYSKGREGRNSILHQSSSQVNY